MASSSSFDPNAEISTFFFFFFFFFFLLCFYLLLLLFREIKERYSSSSSSASTPKLKSLPSSSSSSASPPNLKWTYDVFLSFRGEDTRNNFVGHLYKNLTDKGIHTFRDDEKLERGKEISPELLKAIKESRLAIIIFSENYASSSWCLDELVHIIDCTKETGQIAYPVFYKVDPSNVRKQEGSFAEAFDEHKKKKNLALRKMEKWREALTHAGSLSGWDTQDRNEAEIIKKIVEEIFYKLSRTLPLDAADNLVGMDIHMKEINTLLDAGSNDVKFVGIHGLGGIGKTTIAMVIYNQNYNQFEGCSYLKNVRGSDLVSLQKQLFRDILKVEVDIGNDDSGSSIIQRRLNNKKVLIILDDVDRVNQLEKLAGKGEWFGPGSRIIITTRDQHLLEGVQRYEVKECDRNKSLEIFSWKAFKQDCPPEDYKELSNEVVHYAQCLPLALTVLGSHLRGRSKDAWRGAIEELKIIPNEEITGILEISYKGLNKTQKDVFLDIACFFIGKDKDEVMKKLDSFDFFPSINIQVLIDKSLITVSAENELMMHDLVRDMGRYIVREESPENPGERSRLWNTEDIRQVLENNMATEAIKAIKGIQNNVSMFSWSFKAEAFMEMKNLRLLEWYNYPIKSLWNGRQADLPHLKSIDLSYSFHLREFPDVTGLPNLEELSLLGCRNLVEIHPSVWVHKGLKFLDLSFCDNLKSFPNKIEMESLEQLDLTGCSTLKKLPENIGDLESLVKLSAFRTAIKEVPSSIQFLDKLRILSFGGCTGLKLPSFNGLQSSLTELDLSYCDLTDETFPSNIEWLSSLETLLLSYNNFESLPTNISQLSLLTFIDLSYCERLKSVPELPSRIRICTYGCTSLGRPNWLLGMEDYLKRWLEQERLWLPTQ